MKSSREILMPTAYAKRDKSATGDVTEEELAAHEELRKALVTNQMQVGFVLYKCNSAFTDLDAPCTQNKGVLRVSQEERNVIPTYDVGELVSITVPVRKKLPHGKSRSLRARVTGKFAFHKYGITWLEDATHVDGRTSNAPAKAKWHARDMRKLKRRRSDIFTRPNIVVTVGSNGRVVDSTSAVKSSGETADDLARAAGSIWHKHTADRIVNHDDSGGRCRYEVQWLPEDGHRHSSVWVSQVEATREVGQLVEEYEVCRRGFGWVLRVLYRTKRTPLLTVR